jgi:RNA polymerase sigma-70 factor, ECF subfamily
MREVLGFSAKESADTLDTTVQSVNSALQRARATVDERLPEESQQATLRTLGDERIREIVEAYMDAMQRGDVKAVVGMLAEDAAWSMPPLESWYRGSEAIGAFLAGAPLSGKFRWRHVATHASGQPASAAYTWHPDQRCYLPFALDVLTMRGEQIEQVTSFITRSAEVTDPAVIERWPDTPPDEERVAAVFGRLGLPARLD